MSHEITYLDETRVRESKWDNRALAHTSQFGTTGWLLRLAGESRWRRVYWMGPGNAKSVFVTVGGERRYVSDAAGNTLRDLAAREPLSLDVQRSTAHNLDLGSVERWGDFVRVWRGSGRAYLVSRHPEHPAGRHEPTGFPTLREARRFARSLMLG